MKSLNNYSSNGAIHAILICLGIIMSQHLISLIFSSSSGSIFISLGIVIKIIILGYLFYGILLRQSISAVALFYLSIFIILDGGFIFDKNLIISILGSLQGISAILIALLTGIIYSKIRNDLSKS